MNGLLTAFKKAFDFVLQARRDGGFSDFRAEMNGIANADFDSSRAEPAALAGFEFAQAANGDGEHEHTALFCEQADTGPKTSQLAFGRAGAFRKDEDAVAVVHGIASVRKACLKIALARQREDVEERGNEPVSGRAKEIDALAP